MQEAVLRKWFANVPLIDDPDEVSDYARTEIQDLIGSKALTALYGLLMAERQGYFMRLANLSLSNRDQVTMASVLQGQIRGLDRLAETIIELIAIEVPTNEGASK